MTFGAYKYINFVDYINYIIYIKIYINFVDYILLTSDMSLRRSSNVHHVFVKTSMVYKPKQLSPRAKGKRKRGEKSGTALKPFKQRAFPDRLAPKDR